MGDFANDDPRQILSLLNSLGFVGVTGPQLKAFLKDLKMYRKIKEHKRQVQKESIKEKILFENQQVIEEILQYQVQGENSDTNSSDLSACLSHHRNDSPVKIKITYTPKPMDEPYKGHTAHSTIKCSDRKQTTVAKFDQVNISEIHPSHCNSEYGQKRSSKGNKTSASHCSTTAEYLSSEEDAYYPIRLKSIKRHAAKPHITLADIRPTSAPSSLKHTLQCKNVVPRVIGSAQRYSNPPTNNFNLCTQKSFIRPWHLQQKAHMFNCVKKSDPVSLYQKYQEEWKKIDFPGEATHSNLRWAIRQKMLGTNPNLTPLSKKHSNLIMPRRKQLS